ncbi:MAG: hypothetical protein AAB578_04750 [Elusimicrobiota bacterium]
MAIRKSRHQPRTAAFALLMTAFPAARAAELPPCPPGWDAAKWSDAKHVTPKYRVGRIIAGFPHDPAGLRTALPLIQVYHPGSSILPGKGDKIHIPCVGSIDLIRAAGGPSGGEAWQWLVDKDECGLCKPDVCESGRSEDFPYAPPAPAGASAPRPGRSPGVEPRSAGVTCKPPNAKAAVESVLARPGMSDALRRACRNRTDWTFPDAVIDELRRKDERWGYWCRRGNCGDPSHDVLAYYCGYGKAVERSDAARGVDYIVASCYNEPGDGNPSIGWTLLEPNPRGTAAWTSRGRFKSGPPAR